MARIVVFTASFHGDVMPFVAPANLLVARGHDVTFLVPAGFHPMLAGERFALARYPLDLSTAAQHADPELQRLMRHPRLNLTRLARNWMHRALLDAPDAVRTTMTDVFRGADVVVSHPLTAVMAVPVARSLGVPVVIGHLFPHGVRGAAEWCSLAARSGPMGRVRAAAWAAYTAGAGAFTCDRQVNAWRRTLGVGPTRAALLASWMEADHTVVLASRHYMGGGVPDWPPVTWGGFSHWVPAEAHQPDPAVDAYLDAGDAPVLVTLGTSVATSAGPRFATIARDLDRLGFRSLFLVGNRDNLAELGDRPGAFPFAPVARVLPRCRVAVVSGALGTVSAALAAGVPVVVLPQLPDQISNAHQVQKLGVGAWAWHPRQVARAVARVGADPGYRIRARELAVRLATEDGAAALADAAESFVPAAATSRPDRACS